jgi:hypothetical protein
MALEKPKRQPTTNAFAATTPTRGEQPAHARADLQSHCQLIPRKDLREQLGELREFGDHHHLQTVPPSPLSHVAPQPRRGLSMSMSATASPQQYAPTHHLGGQLVGQLATIQQQYHHNHYNHSHVPNLHLNQSYSPHLQQPHPQHTQHTQPLPPHPQLFTIHPQQARPTTTIPPLPPTPAGGPAPTSNADCYTCRRRRVKCDRQLPCCAKCNRTKLECLGYKKPLVWNKGVASRGKMMGKTFPAPAENNSTSTSTTSPSTPNNSKKSLARTAQTPKAKAAEIAAKKEREKGQQKSLSNQSPAQTAVTGNMSPMNQITPLTPVSINSPRSPSMHVEDIEEDVTTTTATGGALISITKRNLGTARYNNIQLLPGELTLSVEIPSPNIFRNLDSQGRYYMDYCNPPSLPVSEYLLISSQLKKE